MQLIRAATAFLVLAFTLTACGGADGAEGKDPMTLKAATDACQKKVAAATSATRFTWRGPTEKIPGEYAYIVGTGWVGEERILIQCSVDLVNHEVVGSTHGPA